MLLEESDVNNELVESETTKTSKRGCIFIITVVDLNVLTVLTQECVLNDKLLITLSSFHFAVFSGEFSNTVNLTEENVLHSITTNLLMTLSSFHFAVLSGGFSTTAN